MMLFTPKNACTLLIVACIGIGSLIRLDTFDATGTDFYFVDVARDYIVSHHIIEYGQIPLTGPDGYGDSLLSSSPVYYYSLAFLLLFNDNVLFPGFFNVILQTLCIILVFFLTREMFGRKTACLATLFFTFFDAIVGQSFHMWQPYSMQFFMLSSLLLCVLSYTKQKLSFLYASVFLFAYSLMLHSSLWALFPVYIGVVGVILAKRKASITQYVKMGASFASAFLMFSLPLIWYFSHYYQEPPVLTKAEALYLVPEPVAQGISDIGVNFFQRFTYFFSFLFEGNITSLDKFTPSIYIFFCICLFLVGSLLYIKQNKKSQKRNYFAILWAALLCATAAVSTLGLMPKFEFPVRYFTPVYVVTLILMAEIIISAFSQYRSKWMIALKIACVMVIFFFASSKLPAHVQSVYSRLSQHGIKAFEPSYMVPADVPVLVKKLKEMKDEQKGSLPHFDVRTFKEDYEDQFMDSLVWFPLEQIFDTALVKVDDRAFRSFGAKDDPTHMFVRCLSNTNTECTNSFLRKYSLKYRVTDVIQGSEEVFYLHAIRI